MQTTKKETDININKISHGYFVKHLTTNECPKNIVILKELSRIVDLIIPYKELEVYS